jgi:methylglyoxal synthase
MTTMAAKKNIALVAHDKKKAELLEWAEFNRDLLSGHFLFATDATGEAIRDVLGFDVTTFESGALGGDQQIGAGICEGKIDIVIFFWDPLEAQPRDSDVRALVRIAAVWNIPLAFDRSSADFMISSPLIGKPYQRLLPDYSKYRTR